jgi:hypothetical protein
MLDLSCNRLNAVEDVHSISKHTTALKHLDLRNNPSFIEVQALLSMRYYCDLSFDCIFFPLLSAQTSG